MRGRGRAALSLDRSLQCQGFAFCPPAEGTVARGVDPFEVTAWLHASHIGRLSPFRQRKQPLRRSVAIVVKRARGVASHQTALRLHGFLLPPWLQEDDAQVHVSRPHARGVAHRRGVVTHGRSVPAEDVAMLHGIPVTSIERTWADLAALLPRGTVDELVVAGDGIVKHPWSPWGRQAPLTTVERLRAALQRAGRYKGVRTA